MAVTELVQCDSCDNIILNRQPVTLITKGLVSYDDGEAYVDETEDSPVIHYCEDCAQALASELRALVGERMLEEEYIRAGTFPASEGTCTGDTCCQTCAIPDGCCGGYPKN